LPADIVAELACDAIETSLDILELSLYGENEI
jgi:hypothetical protein